MDVNEKIKKRRQEMGLSEIEAAKSSDMSIHEYGDIEQHKDEIFLYPDLSHVKKLCEILDLDLFELLNIQCVFCADPSSYRHYFSLSRSQLIAIQRNVIGISIKELGDQIGFHESEIEKLEIDPEHIESWPIGYIQDIAFIINVPIQVLLHVKCRKCGI